MSGEVQPMRDVMRLPYGDDPRISSMEDLRLTRGLTKDIYRLNVGYWWRG
jgi:hypothetical protein